MYPCYFLMSIVLNTRLAHNVAERIFCKLFFLMKCNSDYFFFTLGVQIIN